MSKLKEPPRNAARRLLRRVRPWAIIAPPLVAACAWSSGVEAEVTWTRKSTTTGDLPVPNQGDQQTCCLVLDVDNDGVNDFVVGERTRAPSVVWYKYNGAGWNRYVIDDTRLRPEAGGAACDVDGDGDLDVILGQDSSGTAIWWWENPCPRFEKPWKRRCIKNSGAAKHHDQTAADYDDDGRIELVSWNQKAKKLLLFEIPDDPISAGPWPSTEIYAWSSGREHEGFPTTAVDVDLDGKLDILGGGRWFKHAGQTRLHSKGKPASQRPAFEPRVIDDRMRFTQCAAGQLVRGGRPEVVFSPGDTNGDAKWYEWTAGGWKSHKLRYVVHGHTCEIGDVDGDGNLDILIGEMGQPGAGDDARTFIWYGNGKGRFRETVASHGQGIHEGKLADLDGDGDLDILAKPYHHNSPRLDILLNQRK